jgi:hypothetical protein
LLHALVPPRCHESGDIGLLRDDALFVWLDIVLGRAKPTPPANPDAHWLAMC